MTDESKEKPNAVLIRTGKRSARFEIDARHAKLVVGLIDKRDLSNDSCVVQLYMYVDRLEFRTFLKTLRYFVTCKLDDHVHVSAEPDGERDAIDYDASEYETGFDDSGPFFVISFYDQSHFKQIADRVNSESMPGSIACIGHLDVKGSDEDKIGFLNVKRIV
jgi:hypothetical protein